LKETEKLDVVDFKSANNYTVALMSDGNLYGWGSNESGQMGIKTEIGVEMYETANFATPVVNDLMKGKKIVSFDISEDIMTILLDNNDVLWSGMKLEYTPSLLKLDYSKIGKVKQVTCTRKSIAVLTEDNKIFMKNDYVKH
jgi:alpha-tubulin suppressor-like RCC1 family protein